MSVLTPLETIAEARRGKILVMTNGVFDVLHVGHLRFLEECKALGDLLVVALNIDETVSKLKGPQRPINPLPERAELVLALKPVDFVVAFAEDTPAEILDLIRPDVHTKGGDYVAEELPEYKVVRAYGGRTVILSFLEGRSSTRVIDALMKPS
jgi:glycerol-3-phosphate cytidylyltransferase